MTQTTIIAFPRDRIVRTKRSDPNRDLFHPGATVKGRPETRHEGRQGQVLETHICPYTKSLLQVLVQWEWVRSWVTPGDLIAVKLPARQRH